MNSVVLCYWQRLTMRFATSKQNSDFELAICIIVCSRVPLSWLSVICDQLKLITLENSQISLHGIVCIYSTFWKKDGAKNILRSNIWHKLQLVVRCRQLKLSKARFIHRISAVSNAIQTKDNEANHLIIYCLNCIWHGGNATYEPGLTESF